MRRLIFATCSGLALLCSGPMVHAQQATADNGSEAKDYLYFRDEAPRPNDAAPAQIEAHLAFVTPRPFIDVSRDQIADGGFVGLFTPRKLNAQIGLVFGANGEGETKRGLGIALISSLEQQDQSDRAVASLPSLGAFDSRSYNFGLAIDYWGFSLGANLVRQESAFDDIRNGLDVDLSYSGKSWRTSLQVSGQQSERTSRFIDVGGIYDRLYAVQLGAAFELTPAWSLTGGLRYSGFRNRFDLGVDANSDSRIFMGTAITF